MRDFIFTITAGRTGTAFLAELLKRNLNDVQSHHEILGYDKFGVDTPDVSHFTLFNSQGNVAAVQEFWAQKIQKIIHTPVLYYVETSHLLIKAGLAENCIPLTKEGTVHFVILKRDYLDTIISYITRGDFLNKGNMWMFYLDPQYPRNIVNAAPFLKFEHPGVCYWYLYEMECRAEYYKLKLASQTNIIFHEINLPELNIPETVAKFVNDLGNPIRPEDITIPGSINTNPKNNKPDKRLVKKLKQMLQYTQPNPKALAQYYINDGRSLG